MKNKIVFIGIKAVGEDIFASETKIGLAGKLDVSGRTVERALGKSGGKWVIVKSGKTGSWRICSVELVSSRVYGDSSRFESGLGDAIYGN